jgi:DNA polymerase-3 subunit beta
MEFTADRKRLQEALQVVGGVAMLRTLKDVLQNVYLEAEENTVTLKATDYEVGIQVRLPEMNVSKPGVLLLPAAQTVGIFRELSEPEVTLRSDGKRCEIVTGRSRFRVVQYDPELFPGLPEFPSTLAARVSRADLLAMIRQVAFSSAEERTRYAFDGIKFQVQNEQIRMVSTDGKRLSYYWMPSEIQEAGEVDALLPARAMTHFIKALGGEGPDCELGIEGNRFGIRSENVVLYCQQIEGSFPNFVPLIEKELPRHVMLDSEELLGALRRASLFAGSEARVVRLRLEAGNLNVNSNVAEMGEAETDLAIEYDGEPMELGFNPDYLMDFLKIVGSGSVRMEFKDDQSASRWSLGERFLYLVMPVSR